MPKKLVKFAYTHRKTLAAIFVLYCTMAVAGIFFGAYFSPRTHGDSSTEIVTLNTGWRVCEDGEEVTADAALPYAPKNKDYKVIDMYQSLPNTEFPSGVIISTVYQKELEVFLGDKLLYSYRPETPHRNSFTPGSGRFFINLPDSFGGQELHMRYYRVVPSDTATIVPVLLQSTRQSPYFFIPGSEILFVLMLSLFIMGLALFALSIFSGGFEFLASPLFPLSIFAISTSAWITCNTKLAQFFSNNLILIHNLEYVSFFIMPVALWMFAWLNWHYCPRITLPTVSVMSIFFALAVTLKFFGLVDFYTLLVPFHLLLLVNCLSLFASIKITYRTADMPLRIFFSGFVILVGCMLFEIIHFYLWPTSETILPVTVLGIISLAVSLVISYLYSYKQRMQIRIEDSMYKKLAYTDKLTGLRNRLTFEEDIAALAHDQDNYHSIIIANLDVDNFKRVNDTYGHMTGDEVLKLVANEVASICDNTARKCYRLGGDEFCIIATNDNISRLSGSLTEMNAHLDIGFPQFPISVSFGVAEYNKFLHSSLMDVFKAADDFMYRSKQGLHRRAGDRR